MVMDWLPITPKAEFHAANKTASHLWNGKYFSNFIYGIYLSQTPSTLETKEEKKNETTDCATTFNTRIRYGGGPIHYALKLKEFIATKLRSRIYSLQSRPAVFCRLLLLLFLYGMDPKYQ